MVTLAGTFLFGLNTLPVTLLKDHWPCITNIKFYHLEMESVKLYFLDTILKPRT